MIDVRLGRIASLLIGSLAWLVTGCEDNRLGPTAGISAEPTRSAPLAPAEAGRSEAGAMQAPGAEGPARRRRRPAGRSSTTPA